MKFRKKASGLIFFKGPFLRGLFFEVLTYSGKFAFQNRLGLYWEGNLRLKIDWASLWLEANFISNLQKVFTESSLENVDVTETMETKPCEYFVYMERGNPSQELRVNYANSNIV